MFYSINFSSIRIISTFSLIPAFNLYSTSSSPLDLTSRSCLLHFHLLLDVALSYHFSPRPSLTPQNPVTHPPSPSPTYSVLYLKITPLSWSSSPSLPLFFLTLSLFFVLFSSSIFNLLLPLLRLLLLLLFAKPFKDTPSPVSLCWCEKKVARKLLLLKTLRKRPKYLKLERKVCNS